MTDIITTLHPENDAETNLYPNIKKENIPDESINASKLDANVLSMIGSLKPSGTDTSTNILAFTENKGIYIGTDTGNWYYWDGTHYVSGGVYQSTAIGSGVVGFDAFDDEVLKEYKRILLDNVIITNTTRKNITINNGDTVIITEVSGNILPTNRVYFETSGGSYLDYFTINNTYGKSRIVKWTRNTVGKVYLQNTYSNGIVVSVLNDWSLEGKLLNVNDDISKVNSDLSDMNYLLNNGYYYYQNFSNITYTRQTGQLPTSYADNKRLSTDIFDVKQNEKVIIRAYEGQVYGYGVFVDNGSGGYNNPIWTIINITTDTEYIAPYDCKMVVYCAKSDTTQTFNISELGIKIEIYDSYLYYLDKKIDDNDISIKSYYDTEYITTLNSIKELITEPCLIFPKLTDIHYNPDNNPKVFDEMIEIISKLNKDIKLDCIVNLGDNINGSSNKQTTIEQADYMLKRFNELKIPYLFTIGNHDTNYDPSPLLTIEETYGSYFYLTDKKAKVNKNTNGTDYYIDYDDLGIRLVFINVNYLGAYVINNSTVTWFTNEALNTDKVIILCVHMSVYEHQNVSNQMTANSNAISSAIDTFINNGGTVIQMFGHSHADYYFTSPILSIASNCCKFEQSDTSSTPYSYITGNVGTIEAPARTINTDTVQSFDIVIVKPTSRKINMIRFGAGNDREFTY